MDASTNEISYNKLASNFSGRIFFTNLAGQFITGYIYKDGKIIKNIAQKPKSEVKSSNTTQMYSATKTMDALWPPEGCELDETEWYTRTCTYYNDGSTECSPWEYSHSSYEANCEYGGGGGQSGPPNCSYQVDDFLNSFSGSNTMTTITNTGSTATTREKTYKWLVLYNSVVSVYSFEKGVHKKVTNPNPALEWEWESLTHNSLQEDGYTGVGVATFTTAASAVTMGTYVAGIQVTPKGTYTISCLGYPFTKHKIYSEMSMLINVTD